MLWEVEFDEDFADEFAARDDAFKIELAAKVVLLRQFGPQLGRPHVDTLKASRHVNMKELRFWTSDGVWRVAFAFDPTRAAILLVAGDKSVMSERRFYRELIKLADRRFDRHLKAIAGQQNGKKS
jgi:hypothetical protein